MIKTALFIGRFQPFHNEHLQVVKEMFNFVDKVIICIGSTQESKTTKNPFTYKESFDMIDSTLTSVLPPSLEYEIVGAPDMEDDNKWADYILTLVGKIDVVYTGNEHVAHIFRSQGIEITYMARIGTISGKEIRKRMKAGTKWEHLVPEQVVEKIKLWLI